MSKDQRRIVVVDQELQHGLSRRLITYWAGTWFAVFALPIMARMISEPMSFDQLCQGIISDFWFPMLVSILLLPIVAWDCIRFSHRAAGPIFRINRVIRDMSNGKPAQEIRLRSNDFCGELADNVNLLIERQAAERESAHRPESLEPVA